MVGGVGEDDQGKLRRKLIQSSGHVRMRAPRGYRRDDGITVGPAEVDLPARAAPGQSLVKHLGVGLPLTQGLVEPIGCEVVQERRHVAAGHSVAQSLPGDVTNAEVDEGPVAVEGNELDLGRWHWGSAAGVGFRTG